MSTADPHGGPPRRPSFDAYSQTDRSRPANAGHFIQYALVFVGLALAARVGWSVWQTTQGTTQQEGAAAPDLAQTERSRSSVPARDSVLLSGPSSANGSEVNEDNPWTAAGLTATPAVASQGQRDIARARQRELLQLAAELTRRLTVWREEDRQWQTVVVPLLDNDAGKGLAADATAMKGFRAVYEQSRPELSRTIAIEEIAGELTANARAATADDQNPYRPEAEAIQRLTDLVGEARSAAESYRQCRLQIMALVADTRTQPGTKTLRAAIAEDEQTERLAAVEAVRERMEAARKDADAKIAAAKEQMIRHSGDAEAQRILAALEAAKAQQAIDDQKHQQEQAKKQRAAALEKDLAEIKRSLLPFVTKGYSQPAASGNTRTTEAVPMSLSKMASKGALNPTQEGMAAMIRLANFGNDRPRGAFPEMFTGQVEWNRVDMGFITRAQKLLIQHGEAMVESGLLSE